MTLFVMFRQVEEKAKAKLKEASKQELAKAKDELKAKIPTKERRAKIVREFTDIDKIKVALPLGVPFVHVRDSAAFWHWHHVQIVTRVRIPCHPQKEVRYFGENVVRGFKLCAEGVHVHHTAHLVVHASWPKFFRNWPDSCLPS
jgi:hypothetical protein